LLIASDAGLLPNECRANSGHVFSSSSCLSSTDSSSLFKMDTIDLLLSPFDSAYATFLQLCVHIKSDDIIHASFCSNSSANSSVSLQSSLSADLVQIDTIPDLPLISDDELLALTLHDISPAHWALHALDLHLCETCSS